MNDQNNNDNLQKSIKTKIDKINSLQMEILNFNIDSKTEVDNHLSQFKNEINDNLLEYKRIINLELVSIKNDIKILDKKNEMYDLNNNKIKLKFPYDEHMIIYGNISKLWCFVNINNLYFYIENNIKYIIIEQNDIFYFLNKNQNN